MFKKIREWLEGLQEQKVQGLAKAMRVQDKYLRADATSRQLSVNYGAAYIEVHRMYECGEISWAERQIVMDVLMNHYDKMWELARFREKMA